MLLEESGNAPDIVSGRGCWTANKRSELPEAFKPYQRRAPALVIPTYSPDGKTTGCQLRPDNPRKDKKGKPVKYDSPRASKVILDVHPLMRDKVRHGAGDLWITEGVRKADALASRGLRRPIGIGAKSSLTKWYPKNYDLGLRPMARSRDPTP